MSSCTTCSGPAFARDATTGSSFWRLSTRALISMFVGMIPLDHVVIVERASWTARKQVDHHAVRACRHFPRCQSQRHTARFPQRFMADRPVPQDHPLRALVRYDSVVRTGRDVRRCVITQLLVSLGWLVWTCSRKTT